MENIPSGALGSKPGLCSWYSAQGPFTNRFSPGPCHTPRGSPVVSGNYITVYRLSPTSNCPNVPLKWYLESHKLPARKRQWDTQPLHMGTAEVTVSPHPPHLPSLPPAFRGKGLWLPFRTRDPGVRLSMSWGLTPCRSVRLNLGSLTTIQPLGYYHTWILDSRWNLGSLNNDRTFRLFFFRSALPSVKLGEDPPPKAVDVTQWNDVYQVPEPNACPWYRPKK